MIENCHKNLKNVFMKFESPLIKNSEWKMFLYKEGNVIFFFFWICTQIYKMDFKKVNKFLNANRYHIILGILVQVHCGQDGPKELIIMQC